MEEFWGKKGDFAVVHLTGTMVHSLRKSIRLAHGAAWSVMKGEVKVGEKKRPPGLAPV